jgi:hypothetical protein
MINSHFNNFLICMFHNITKTFIIYINVHYFMILSKPRKVIVVIMTRKRNQQNNGGQKGHNRGYTEFI